MNGKERIDLKGRFIHIGYDNTVMGNRVVAILAPTSAPVKKLRHRAAEKDLLVDVTNGRRTRSILIMDSQHVILSAVSPETLWRRGGAVQGEANAQQD